MKTSPQESDFQRVLLLEDSIMQLRERVREITEKYDKIIEAETELIRKEIEAIRIERATILAYLGTQRVYEAGNYILLNRRSHRRVINPDRFRREYPDVFDNIAEVPIGKAEKAIGKEDLDRVCEHVFGPDEWAVSRKGLKSVKTTEGWYA